MQLSQFNSSLLPKTSVPHPPSPLLYTCLQLWSPVRLPCAALKPEHLCSEPAQLWVNCCVLTAWELERLTEGSEKEQSQGKRSIRGAWPAAGRQVEGADRRTTPFQQQRPVSLAQLDLLTSPLRCFGQQCWLMSAKSVVKQHPMSHFSHVGKQDFNEQFTYLHLRICWCTFCIKALSQEPHIISQEAQQMAFREVHSSAFQKCGPLCQ